MRIYIIALITMAVGGCCDCPKPAQAPVAAAPRAAPVCEPAPTSPEPGVPPRPF